MSDDADSPASANAESATDSAAPRTVEAFAELSGAAQERIDQACDDFEAAWQTVVNRPDQNTAPLAGWPSVSPFVSRLNRDERAAALHELIPIDIAYRRRSGAPISLAEYSAFTELDADWLAQVVLNPDGETRRVNIVSEPVSEPPKSPAPTQLGDYEILEPLGQGGMGTVYRARHRRMDRIVAIKVLPTSTARDPHVANRFRREIRAVARLSHPHIVAAHDAGEDNGVLYLVMECIDGLDLSTWVRRHGPLSVADAVECLAQAADGMDYAHQQGIVHRDIKPSNLLMSRETSRRSRETSDGSHASLDRTLTSSATGELAGLHIKVLDLGLARIDSEMPSPEMTAVTRSGMIFGTAEYMSPEQAMNVRSADQRSDIYSLGCTLYFLLTGRSVVKGETYMEMVMAHQLLMLPSLTATRHDVPDELEQIFRRMTAKKPEQRFASMAEVRDALRAIPRERLSLGAFRPGEAFSFSLEQTAELTKGEENEELKIPKFRQTVVLQTLTRWSSLRSKQRIALIALSVALLLLAIWLSPLIDFARTKSVSRTPPTPLGFPVTAAVAQQTQREWAKYLGMETSQQNSIGMTLVLIPPGEFIMGTTEAEFETLATHIPNADEHALVRNEMPSQRVRLERPFWIGQSEVTIAQFRQFVEDSGYITEAEKDSGYGVVNGQWELRPGFHWNNTGEQSLTDNHPASNLSWNDANAFCEWLGQRETKQLRRPVVYRLPTEAEWEFACRAGTDSLWPFGTDSESLVEYAITFSNSNNRHSSVMSKKPNPFGLFDMLGNESEWCSDLFAPYSLLGLSTNVLINPTGPRQGQGGLNDRVQRGGSFGFQPHRQRSAFREARNASSPQHGSLRVVRDE